MELGDVRACYFLVSEQESRSRLKRGATRPPPVAEEGREASGSGRQMRKALAADEDAGHRNRDKPIGCMVW